MSLPPNWAVILDSDGRNERDERGWIQLVDFGPEVPPGMSSIAVFGAPESVFVPPALFEALVQDNPPSPEQLLGWLRQLRRGLQKMRPSERVSLNYLGTENETKIAAELHAIIAEAMRLGEE
jgi:hypothetical protein